MLQLLQRIAEHATHCGEATALKELAVDRAKIRSINYGALAASIAATADRLHGLPADGVVIVCLPNTIECAIAFLAVLQANRPAFLINPAVAGAELSRAIEASGAAAIFAEDGTARVTGLRRLQLEIAQALPLQPTAAGDKAALLLLSSGTTHEPKIVYRDGLSLDAVARNCAEAIGVDRRDCVLLAIPLCHSYGVEHGILMPLYAGAAVYLCQGMDAGVVIPELRAGEVTLVPGVPSMYEMLAGLAKAEDCGSIRCAYSAGAPLPVSVYEACLKRLGLRVGQLYGSSEVGSVTFNDPRRADHDALGVGRPMAGVRIRTVDPSTRDLAKPLPPGVEGEVAIYSPSMLRHYLGQTASPLHDGFFFTEDLGVLSAGGDLTITGRIKLLIDVGAMKVNPFEVEHALKTHPGVADCLVVGMPISETVHRLKALVVPRDVHSPPDAAALRAHVRERLSGSKVPRVIEFAESLPRSSTGKVLRRAAAI